MPPNSDEQLLEFHLIPTDLDVKIRSLFSMKSSHIFVFIILIEMEKPKQCAIIISMTVESVFNKPIENYHRSSVLNTTNTNVSSLCRLFLLCLSSGELVIFRMYVPNLILYLFIYLFSFYINCASPFIHSHALCIFNDELIAL